MNKPLVSIIMPAFNAERYIEEAIKSVISQTYNNWELLVINDGSTDETATIAGKCASADPRIKLINQANKKLGAARNTGILNAKGTWIAFLDADDLWLPVKLEKQMLVAETEKNAGVIFSDGFTFYNDDINNASPYGTISGLIAATAMYKLEYEGNYIPVLSALVKKSHLDAIGLQDEHPYLYGCEDWDYWLRLAINGVSFYGMEEKFFYYRRHASNMSNDSSLMNLAKATVFIKNFKSELLSKEEIIKINGFINLTICSFIKLGRVKEALFLNNGMYKASGGAFRKVSAFLLNSLGSHSYYLTRMVFKANALLTN